MKIRLLHLDGSLTAQPTLASLAGQGLAQVVNLKPDGKRLRLWATRDAMTDFARRLCEEEPPPGDGAEVTFMGSGDYHHLTAPLVGRTKGPLSVVHFDNHPDWGMWPPAYHCGSWVNRVLDMGHVAKVVTIGPCAADTTWPQFKGANLGALESDRFELHPWRMAPSRVIGKGSIRWNNLGECDWSGFVDDLARRLPTERVYVSIDKDVLHPDEAVTNWNQGEMRLDHIFACLRALAARRRIVGVDVCGEYAPPRFDSLPKRILAHFDQPTPPVAPDLRRNDESNGRLLAELAALGL
ncbi:MAG TPA: arginase family protein [Candidatus Omnitrophota bacterium]|nr:arginase family protein [Candidatus Omnitrophota bacterium]